MISICKRRSSLRDLDHLRIEPGIEMPGYCQSSLRDGQTPFAPFVHPKPPLAGSWLGSAPVPVAVFGVAPLPLKIAQPFMPGTRCPLSSKVPPGTKEFFCRPSRDFFIWLTRYPAMNGWAIIIASLRALHAIKIQTPFAPFGQGPIRDFVCEA